MFGSKTDYMRIRKDLETEKRRYQGAKGCGMIARMVRRNVAGGVKCGRRAVAATDLSAVSHAVD